MDHSGTGLQLCVTQSSCFKIEGWSTLCSRVVLFMPEPGLIFILSDILIFFNFFSKIREVSWKEALKERIIFCHISKYLYSLNR